MSAPHVLIAGAGHAGGRVAQALRAAGFTGRVTMVGEESHAPYERPALSKELLLGRKTVGEIMLEPREFWRDEQQVAAVNGRIAAVGADRVARLDSGETIAFDILVVAAGGHARKLTVVGGDLPEVRTLRSIDDCLALRGALAEGRRLLVIGGGVIGMEAASSAAALGMHVTVLETGPRIMARCLPPEGSRWLQALHEERGVRVETGVAVEAIRRADGVLSAQASRAGQALQFDADLVLAAVGITPATAFLAGSGVALDNGVLTDARCRNPAAPWCYAVGDIANSFNPLYGRHVRQETWRNAENQARAVAASIMGSGEAYEEMPWMWTDQHERNIQVVGIYTPGDLVVSRIAPGEQGGVLLWLHEGKVAGGMLVDCGRERKQLEILARRQAEVEPATLSDTAISLKELARA
ncbi:NAD(P)/FAD-dependent oxidoreductase [Herbaspirillum sp. RV1423]|uniref:NAD(P)/FAD-dependent oxidoreductase n=1 Tax=Herbaspirillum sp. RV1423 TaxID=1443993 RepID=UPI0004B176FA|nr:FAD-dependent oxidoreductase [Herbaspirillum sp. RV1423]